MAKELSQYLPVSTSNVTHNGEPSTAGITNRGIKDFWIAVNPNAYQEKLTPSQQKSSNAYQLLLNRIRWDRLNSAE